MRDFMIDDIDENAGRLTKRAVSSVWLREELVKSANCLRAGSADNLDLYDGAGNPLGCFMHQDVQEAFFRLHGVPRPCECATAHTRADAIMSAVAELERQYS